MSRLRILCSRDFVSSKAHCIPFEWLDDIRPGCDSNTVVVGCTLVYC